MFDYGLQPHTYYDVYNPFHNVQRTCASIFNHLTNVSNLGTTCHNIIK